MKPDYNTYRKCRECGGILALVVVAAPPNRPEKAVSHDSVRAPWCLLFKSTPSDLLWDAHINDPAWAPSGAEGGAR
jgi:hypothetical protein